MYTMIRILPMDRKYEFGNADINEIQENFFLTELPSRKDNIGYGKYCYKTRGMRINKGSTLVLFQYDNKIIACASLYDTIKLDKVENIYHGAFYFEPSSIKVFNPISNQQINNIFNCIKKFGQVKHHLEPSFFSDFMGALKNVKKVDLDTLLTNERPTCISNIREN